MSETAVSPKNIIRLKYGDDSQLLVEMKDGDRFGMTSTDAAMACHFYEAGKKAYGRQVQELSERLTSWFKNNAPHVKEARLGPRPDGLLFLVVMSKSAYNPELEDRMTELEAEIAQDATLDMIRLEVLAVPDFGPASFQAFLPAADE